MKNQNYTKKIIYILVFFTMFVFNIKIVNAGCTYNVGDFGIKTDTVIDIYGENGKLTAKCTDDDPWWTVNEGCMIDGTGTYTEKFDNIFVTDKGKFYCPSTIYVCNTQTMNNAQLGSGQYWYSFSLKDLGGNVVCKKVEISNISAVDKFNKYDSVDQATGKLSVCEIASEAEIADYKKRVNAIGDLNSMTSDEVKKALEDLQSILDSIQANKKCSAELSTLVLEIGDKISGYTGENYDGENFDEVIDSVENMQQQVGNITKDRIGKFMISTNSIEYDCEGLLDGDLKLVLVYVLKIIRIGAPILLIVLTTIDFAQAVITEDQDAIKKAVSKVIKRVIAAIALFFVPVFVEILINMPGVTDYVSKSPDCNLEEVE